jgi:hypothetical protein
MRGKRTAAVTVETPVAPTVGPPLPAAKPMTKAEREDLRRHINRLESVMKSAAEQRSAELLADFEQQVASIYAYDDDAIWSKAYKEARDAARAAARTIARRCATLGIPKEFAPSLELYWHGRGQTAVKQRRDELRRVALARVRDAEKKAFHQIERQCLELQTQVLAHGLTTDAAKIFFEAIPTVERLMPPLDFAKIESALGARGVGRQWNERELLT